VLAIALTLHLLAALVWVGGMFFAWMAMRPAAAALEPAVRLPLWARTFARFFPWVWAAVAVLPVTGYWMAARMGGLANAGVHVQIMHGVGWFMIAIFLMVYFAFYARLRRALAASDWPAGGDALGRIRFWIGINLLLGLGVVVIARAGPLLN